MDDGARRVNDDGARASQHANDDRESGDTAAAQDPPSTLFDIDCTR
jgi:hypothetical protein